MIKLQHRHRLWLLILSALILTLLAVFFSPIHQSRNFYDYADQRTILSIPNFWNVITNLPFALVGIIALKNVKKPETLTLEPTMRNAYLTMFWGLIAVCIGSGYYHLVPDAFSLMIDRIALSIVFMALYCIVLAEYISLSLGKRLLLPLIVYSTLSVVYWYITDITTGRGDMSAYVLVQVIPIIHLPVIIALFKAKFSHGRCYVFALVSYVISKWAESNDELLYELTNGFSGHSFKHLFAALGGYFVYWGLKKRQVLKKGR
ncbi:ceramidase domain-containing protein [Photobacterium sp. J15]|uniref:ceramidase domain-containing protein n=1 Tax=Photobacterium sp. J15 TaxID=265901 RepID=UPI0007E34DE5|nr:ceramidase domain-containing protein [Photobacterium sp. J15]